MWPYPQETADLVTITEEIFNFLCCDTSQKYFSKITRYKFLRNEVYNQVLYFKDLLKLRETSRLKREAYKMNQDIPRTNQVTLELRVLEFTGQKYGTRNHSTLSLLKIFKCLGKYSGIKKEVIPIVQNAQNRKNLVYFIFICLSFSPDKMYVLTLFFVNKIFFIRKVSVSRF